MTERLINQRKLKYGPGTKNSIRRIVPNRIKKSFNFFQISYKMADYRQIESAHIVQTISQYLRKTTSWYFNSIEY